MTNPNHTDQSESVTPAVLASEDDQLVTPVAAAPVDQTDLYQALAIIEQFEQLQSRLLTYRDTLPTAYQTELDVHLDTLKSLIALLDMVDSPLENLTGALPMSGRLQAPLIERLGLSGELLKLRAQRHMTIQQIADLFKLKESTVRRFYRFYDKAKPSKKAQLQRASIFDTTEQLELLSITIQRTMARLEGVNDDVNIKYISELRQTIQLAAQMAEKMANVERYNNFMRTVYEILQGELPQKRAEILQKIAAAGSTTPQLLRPR